MEGHTHAAENMATRLAMMGKRMDIIVGAGLTEWRLSEAA
jgi:hypothetical protein